MTRPGIEPRPTAYKASILPLGHGRSALTDEGYQGYSSSLNVKNWLKTIPQGHGFRAVVMPVISSNEQYVQRIKVSNKKNEY